MRWFRVRAKDKLAFREDLQADPTLTDLQKRMISVIAQNWDGESMHSECSLSFIAAGAGTTKKMVNKYAPSLVASGRVSVKRAASFTESTLWEVSWFFAAALGFAASVAGRLRTVGSSPPAMHKQSPPALPMGTPPPLPVPQRCQSPKWGTNSYLTVEIGAPKRERALMGARLVRQKTQRR